jgi:hypothetical protein
LNIVGKQVPLGTNPKNAAVAVGVMFDVTGTEVVDKQGNSIQAVAPRVEYGVTLYLDWAQSQWAVKDLTTNSTGKS